MPLLRARTLLVALLLSVSTGCSPALVIQQRQPPLFTTGSLRKISVQVTGRKTGLGEGLLNLAWLIKTGTDNDAKAPPDWMQASLEQKLTEGGYFQLAGEDERECSFQMQLDGWRTALREPVPGKEDARFLDGALSTELRVLDRSGKQLAGRVYPVDVEHPLAEGESREQAESAALAKAMEVVASAVASEYTPQRVPRRVVMDDSAPEVKAAVALLKEDRLDEAATELKAVLARTPNSAPALYNLGLIHEAKGELDEARAAYLKAQGVEAKGLYEKALERLSGWASAH